MDKNRNRKENKSAAHSAPTGGTAEDLIKDWAWPGSSESLPSGTWARKNQLNNEREKLPEDACSQTDK